MKTNMSIQVPARVEVMHWRQRFPWWCPLRLGTLGPALLWSWKTPVILIITLLYLHVHGTTDYYSINCALFQFHTICMIFTRHSLYKNFMWKFFVLHEKFLSYAKFKKNEKFTSPAFFHELKYFTWKWYLTALLSWLFSCKYPVLLIDISIFWFMHTTESTYESKSS